MPTPEMAIAFRILVYEDTRMTQAVTPTRTVQLPEVGEAISRGDRVVEVLRNAILEGQFSPGQPLIERELASVLGISKTPVREALKQLVASGLVTKGVGQGMIVRVIDRRVVIDSAVARAGVEPYALRLAVEARGAAPWPEARDQLEASRQHLLAGRVAEHGLANRQFHRVLYSASGNAFLIDFLSNLSDLGTLIATTGWRLGGADEQEVLEHARIIDAAERGEAAHASELLRHHIETAAGAHIAALDERGMQ
ncbi:GntR family transcriptional regulator [Microbacterium esteraromaticum]|uniref:GntR family transcriptional regulator n=1 Tax=Microbacterium esteraromaticum TaxID=57043 RepID=A0A7D7WG55_9MICO|nr:GntR family transcriptional regulator [Microbacterium esteraromaticum]QMU96473.1 GntR family transcriptional regulator [Microbacterium esteraromaticum]